ncbi:hypothetical protein TSUD_413040, partial [Trifolium subterraneum]
FDQKELNMRHRRWLEFLKDYDFELSYHPGKANVVADALSRKSLHMSSLMAKELEWIEEFRDLSLVCEITSNSVKLGMLKLTNPFLEKIRECQKEDEKLMKRVALVIEGQENDFKMDENGVVRFRGRVCEPDVPELKRMIFDEGHKSGLSIHPGLVKMYQDLKKLFWWPRMHKEIAEYVYACLVCQKSKIEHQKPSGLLQPLSVPEWKWDSIAMDFVGGLPKTAKGNEVIWVVVDRLTKSAHFIAIKIGTLVPKLAEIYVEQIIRLHGIPSSIVSDRDPKFTSRFWESLQEALGTKLRLSSAYHPQTDGQSERTIQSLEDLLRACVLEQGESWDSCLPLIEFTYNNSFQSSIGMAPFEALYGRRCRTPLCWYESGETVVLGPDIVQETTEKIRMIREKMKASQSRQKSYHDKRRKDVEFQEGDHVFLRVTSTTGVGRALKSRKLTSKFIGPYQISERIGKVAYRIALPITLSNLHDVFHVSQLRKYVSDPSHVIEPDDIQVKDNLTIETIPLRIEGREVKKLRNKEIASVKVIWGGPAGENATWELESKMKGSYPELFSGFLYPYFGEWYRMHVVVSRGHGMKVTLDAFRKAQSSDRWQWQPDPDTGYTVRGAYHLLTSHDSATMDDAEMLIWHSQVPLKVSILVWRLLRDRLPTKANLVTRGIIPPTAHFCVTGCGAVESAHHLFISCSIFGSLWPLVCSRIGITLEDFTSIRDHFVQFTSLAGGSRKRRSFLQLFWLACVWVVWRERNHRLFRGSACSVHHQLDKIKLISFRWLKATSVTLASNYHSWWSSPLLCLGLV